MGQHELLLDFVSSVLHSSYCCSASSMLVYLPVMVKFKGQCVFIVVQWSSKCVSVTVVGLRLQMCFNILNINLHVYSYCTCLATVKS